jgi:hypothetical protein
MGGVTAVRSNSQPAAGVASLQPAPPTPLPTSIEQLVEYLTPAITAFRRASVPMSTELDEGSLGNSSTSGLGQTSTVRIDNVGLGYRIVREHTDTYVFANTDTAAATVDISPWMPFNIINRNTIQLNGGATTFSASGPATFVTGLRTRRGAMAAAIGSGVSAALVRVTAGSALTLTAATGPSASGYKSISVAASTTAGASSTLTVTWYEIIRLAHSRNDLLGSLPLQNNKVFAQLITTSNSTGLSSSSTAQDAPFYNSSNSGLTLSSYYGTIKSTYKFWAVPTNPALYAPLVQNSFQINEQTSITTQSGGSGAFTYDIPQNTYLIAMHLFTRGTNGAYTVENTSLAGLTKAQIQYNGGSVIPVTFRSGRHRAEQWADYGDDMYQLAGYLLWDGSNTSDDLTESDQAGWIDTYYAASPQLVGDVDANVSTPLTTSVTREVLVPGAVQVVGG